MQIECPCCGTAYEVPDDILARKRTMRCARCARDWSPLSAPPPAPVPVQVQVQEAAPALAAPAAPPLGHPAAAVPRASVGKKVAVVGAWAASLAVLAGAGWWGVTSRTRIVHAWPASERVYAVLGLQAGQEK